MKRQWPFYLIVLSIFIFLVSSDQFADGMFLDGITYATIARNMSMGLGYIWKPYYTASWVEFYEHPPLAFWLESLLFRIFGDTIYVERVYSLLTFLLTGGVIVLIWKRVTGKYLYGWLPLLAWISIPLVYWASPNNMLENTMMVFTSLSVYFFLKREDAFYFIILSGLSLAFAFLSKGVFCLYVLSLPFWIWLCRSEIRFARMFNLGLLLVLFAVAPFLLMSLYDVQFLHGISEYWNQQVVKSVQQEQTVQSRFSILMRLLTELLIPLMVTSLLVGVAFKKRAVDRTSFKEHQSWTLMFFGLGLAGVVPIMISLKQRGFYILTTFPFFALGFALVALPVVKILVEKIQDPLIRVIKPLSILVLAISLAVMLMKVGTIGRDHNEMNDLYATLKVIPKNTTISLSRDLTDTWELHAYYGRYGNITLDPNNRHDYLLVEKINSQILPGYQKIQLQTTLYDLYKRQ